MVVRNFNVRAIAVTPDKTNTPLIVDTNAVLSSAPAFKRFKPIPWWYQQVSQSGGIVQHPQFPARGMLHIER
jgi:hypothetical protein